MSVEAQSKGEHIVMLVVFHVGKVSEAIVYKVVGLRLSMSVCLAGQL